MQLRNLPRPGKCPRRYHTSTVALRPYRLANQVAVQSLLEVSLPPIYDATMNSANDRRSDDANSLGGRLAVWVATGLGVGLVTIAPGTIGGLWGLPLAWAVGQIASPLGQQLAVVAIGLLGVAICTRAARALGGEKDPQAIVLDEIAALPIVLLGVSNPGPTVWLLAFALFRLFDITKPFPARQAERLPAGWGIMADDWVAAGYAWIALQALFWVDQALNLAWLSSPA